VRLPSRSRANAVRLVAALVVCSLLAPSAVSALTYDPSEATDLERGTITDPANDSTESMYGRSVEAAHTNRMMPAIAASDYDVQVTLFEKNEDIWASTAMSGGSMVAAGTKLQREAGINDSPDLLVADIMKKNYGEGDEDVIRPIVEEARHTLDWFYEDLGWDMVVNTGPFGRIGHSKYRRHWLRDENGTVKRDGSYLVRHLYEEVESRDIEVLTNSPVRELVTEDGEILGVVAGKNRKERIKADAVLLASGGYGSNQDIRREYAPTSNGVMFGGNEGNEGDSVRWAEEIGIKLVNMTGYLANPSYIYPEGVMFPWIVTKMGGFVVNKYGVEFADAHASSYGYFSARLIEQPEKIGYVIFDQYAYDQAMETDAAGDRMKECVDVGAFESAETIRDLAEELDLNPSLVHDTFIQKNRDTVRKLNGPYYGSAIQAGVNQTKGGIKVNPQRQATTVDGDVVPNLYAGGLASEGLSGSRPEGYLSGSGIMNALNSGKIMGRHAAETIASN
jgi:fumarate reductase flavoprotein subunit